MLVPNSEQQIIVKERPLDSAPVSSEVKAVQAQDGYRLFYRVWPCPKPRAKLAILTGLMSHSLWYQSIAETLQKEGIHVVGADRRGSGMNKAARGDAPSRQILLDDLRRIIEEERPAQGPLFLMGFSWGAVLAVNAALDGQQGLEGLILIAPGLFPSDRVRHNIQKEEQRIAESGGDASRLRSPIQEEMFTRGPALEGFILKDQLRVRHMTARMNWIMKKMGALAVTRLRHLRQPVLLLLASHDLTADNSRTVAAFQALPASRVSSETLPGQHGLQFEAPRQVSRSALTWMAEIIAGPTPSAMGSEKP